MTDPIALAQLRHLYQNMVNGAVRDTASAKRMAEGLLALAIEVLERGDFKEQTMTEPTELMPCPFCGGNARKVKHSAGSPGTTGYDRWHGVACAGCNACVGARDRRFRTSSAAIAAWNRRTPQPTQAQAGAVPLTLEVINAMAREYPAEDLCGWSYIMGVADAERHHGIKGGQHGTE